MKYTTGKVGRTVVAKIENNDDLLSSLYEIIEKEKIKAGMIFLLGAIRKGKMVCGPVRDEIPPEAFWRKFPGPSETVGVGTIFCENGKPKIHLHAALGRGKQTFVGCLRTKIGVFLISEAVIIELKGVKAERKFDKKSGLTLLVVDGK